MKGTATWTNNDVKWVKWEGNNIDEIIELIGTDYKLSTPILPNEEKVLYVHGIGKLRIGDYLTESNRNLNVPTYEIHSWKLFPRMINEDIGSGLSR